MKKILCFFIPFLFSWLATELLTSSSVTKELKEPDLRTDCHLSNHDCWEGKIGTSIEKNNVTATILKHAIIYVDKDSLEHEVVQYYKIEISNDMFVFSTLLKPEIFLSEWFRLKNKRTSKIINLGAMGSWGAFGCFCEQYQDCFTEKSLCCENLRPRTELERCFPVEK